MYAMNVQLVCDDRRRIIYYTLGWPGSVSDSVAFGQSKLYQGASTSFSAGQYLLADAGYGGTWFMCTPYKHPQAALPHNKLYNELFSSARVTIEHVNGILKGRFSSLRGIRIQVKEVTDFKRINEWILVCLVLHNILLRLNDSWDEEYQNDVEEQEGHAHAHINETSQAQSLRISVQDYLLNRYFNTL
jgi:hypothetical protein